MLTVCDVLQMETSSLEHSSPLHQSSTETSEPQLSLSPPRQSKSDERTTIGKHSLIKTNRFIGRSKTGLKELSIIFSCNKDNDKLVDRIEKRIEFHNI